MTNNNLVEKKKSEIFAFLWATIAGLLFICLWSYTPGDIHFEVSNRNFPIHNYAGVAGAYIAWSLFFVFGKSSYFFVALLTFWSLSAWTGSKKQSVSMKLFSGTIFFVSACACLGLIAGAEPTMQFDGGGLIGFFLAHLLSEIFGKAALYIAVALFFLSVLLTTEFLIFPVLAACFVSLKNVLWHTFTRLGRTFPKTTESNSTFNKLKGRFAHPGSPNLKMRDRFLMNRPLSLNGPSVPKIRTLISKKAPEPQEVVVKPKVTESAKGDYQLPSLDLLVDPKNEPNSADHEEIEQQSRILEETLADFGIDARVVEVEQGPVITRYELQPASGVKVQRIVALTDNISLAMKAISVRVIAPIPGKSRVGIEVPNRLTTLVTLKELLMNKTVMESKSKLVLAIGKDTAGQPVIAYLDTLPHLLIAGSTGTGKTVCVNSIITSILYHASPEEVKLILIDPKMVELSCYNGLPHLLTPVVTQTEKVTSVLAWLVSEMEQRFKTLSSHGVRNISSFNEKKGSADRMPYIVMVIDELADLMLAAGREIENAIMRLAQLSRAVGIHLVLATQRPSVDVITGVIKANFPARISFQVASKVDSRTVLDVNGADALLGKGDLLYLDPALSKPVRAQGALVTDDEIERIVKFIKDQRSPHYDDAVIKASSKKSQGSHDFRNDEHYEEACRIIISGGQASVSMLQRRLGLGYTRAARLVDMMEEDGIVGPFRGSKPREILIDMETLTQKQKESQSSEPTASKATDHTP